MPKEPCAGHSNAGAGDCQSPDSAPVNAVPLQLASLCRPVNFPSFLVLPSCCQALQLCLCLWLLLPCTEGTNGLTFKDQPAGDCLQKSCGVRLAPSLFCCASSLPALPFAITFLQGSGRGVSQQLFQRLLFSAACLASWLEGERCVALTDFPTRLQDLHKNGLALIWQVMSRAAGEQVHLLLCHHNTGMIIFSGSLFHSSSQV